MVLSSSFPPALGWNSCRREWGSAQGHGVLPHPGCVVVEVPESPPGAALGTRGLLRGCSQPELCPQLRGIPLRCCHDSPERGSLRCPPGELGIPWHRAPRAADPFPRRSGKQKGRKVSCGFPGLPFPAGSRGPGPLASSAAPGARQVPVAAVTVSMETELHPGHRGRGCVPLPTGTLSALRGAWKWKSLKCVANVWRNPKET